MRLVAVPVRLLTGLLAGIVAPVLLLRPRRQGSTGLIDEDPRPRIH